MMEKFPIKIIETTTPAGEVIKEIMLDMSDYRDVRGDPLKKIQNFKKKYFAIIEKVKGLFDEGQTCPSSTYYKIGLLLQEFNNEIKNEFEIKNYTEAISRDFGLSRDYINDILIVVKVFKQNQIIDEIPFSYYRALKRKRSDLKKIGLFEKEIARLNKMGRDNKLPGREIYKTELIDKIKNKEMSKKTNLDSFV